MLSIVSRVVSRAFVAGVLVAGSGGVASALQQVSRTRIPGPDGGAGTPLLAVVEFDMEAPSVAENGAPVALTITRSAVFPAPITVYYSVRGTATEGDDYVIESSPVTFAAGMSSTEILLMPVDDMDLESDETVVVTLTAAVGGQLGKQVAQTVTLLDDEVPPVLVSDDFNQCALQPIWSLVDPLADATLETRGAGSDDAQLLLSIPGGNHDVFDTNFSVPRVTQIVPDEDFEIEAKFESSLAGPVRDQGILVLEDELNWARFDFFSRPSGLRLYVATTVAGSSTKRLDQLLSTTQVAPMWLRVNRTGDQWAVYWSLNGTSFTQAMSFQFPLAVDEAGVYVGNADIFGGSNGPAHTMIVDYVFDTQTPVVPEDGAVIGEIGRTLTVDTMGAGSVLRDPDQALYYCSDEVTLTAIPEAGWLFDHWEGDLTGSANPDSVVLDAERSVTAVFVLAATSSPNRDRRAARLGRFR